MKRREFWKKCSFAMGTGAVVSAIMSEALENVVIPYEKSEEQKEYSTLGVTNKIEYVNTVIQRVIFLVIEIKSHDLLKKQNKDIIIGNSNAQQIDQDLKDDFLKSFTENVLTYPFYEEYMFRFLPSICINMIDEQQKGKNVWSVGIITSLLFGGLHGFKTKEGKEVIPMTQTMSGIYYWHLMRTRGFLHAVLGHSLMNFIGSFEYLKEFCKKD